ncbi:MAG TPA: PEP-CTERM sorting domain-containing protein [Thermoguttaceae bacterium]|nr:PEP-CTERM sorting domain-containing protein [Thermoguttaceae bacterium]
MKTKTIDAVACLGAMVILLVLAQVTQAAITITELSWNGSNSILYEGTVKFPDYGGYEGDGTIIAKSLEDMDPYVLKVDYLASDFDASRAFRWAERVTNPAGSGNTWDAYEIDLLGTTATFGGEFWTQGSPSYIPGMAAIGDLTTSPVTIDILSTLGSPAPNGDVMTLSADKGHISIVFGTPIAPGDTFDIHIPIWHLGAGDGSFQLTQHAVPEPASLAIWSLLGLGIAGLRWRRRKGG